MEEKRTLYRLYCFIAKKCPESQKSDSGTNGAGGVEPKGSDYPVLTSFNPPNPPHESSPPGYYRRYNRCHCSDKPAAPRQTAPKIRSAPLL